MRNPDPAGGSTAAGALHARMPPVKTVVEVAALTVAGVNLLPGAVGALRWWQVEQSAVFWRLVRLAQVACGVLALVAGVAAASGASPDDGLLWLYLLLPVAVNVVAEQLRAVSAQTVLDDRGLEGAEAMRALPEETQRSIVVQILRKEMGVMTIAALVVAFLCLRAWGVTGGL